MNEILPKISANTAEASTREQTEISVEEKANVLNHQGVLFFHKGALEPAKAHFLATLMLVQDHPQALQNLGAVLRNQGHLAAAASVSRRSVRASNNNAFCRSNLGVSLLGLRRYRESLEVLASVLKDMPENGPSWHNYGLVLYMLGEFEGALEAFDTGRKLANMGPNIDSDRALTLLAMGLIAEGLEAYEVRWEILSKSRIWGLGFLEWQGETPAGQKILVHHEQGFGDSIMLSRFIPTLVALGAHVTVAVPAELLKLYEDSFGEFVSIVDFKDERLGQELQFDYHVPMLSLMRHLGVKRPSDLLNFSAVYLKISENDIVDRLPKTKRKIGICWASGDHGPSMTERRRVAKVTDFLSLTEIPGFSVISLQKGPDVRDLEANGLQGLIFDLAPRLTNFADTAAVIAELDFVISVDSAVAHLAGALGVPCIMLSPFSRCWRWWNEGSGLPWYLDMKVFSQVENGTWDEAISCAIGEVLGRLGISADV